MIHPQKLKKGDTVAIVSLSDGVLGKEFVKHEVVLLEERLTAMGLKYKYMDNSKKGSAFLKNHPEARAADLRQAFLDQDIQMIWSALGGDDTFRTIPYLMNDEFREIVHKNPKIFLGMSDTTNNHFMLHRLGLSTFYGPALLSDIAELGPEVFPYTMNWIEQLFADNHGIEITSSPVWYRARESFGEDQLGIPRPEVSEAHGFEFLHGTGVINGELFGGCLDSIYELFKGGRYEDQLKIFEEFPLFPQAEELNGKVLFLETSEEQMSPKKYQDAIDILTEKGVLSKVAALLAGKPQNEAYYQEYKEILQGISAQHNLPIIYNMNFGHTTPRMILPYDIPIRIDFDNHKLTLPKGMGFNNNNE